MPVPMGAMVNLASGGVMILLGAALLVGNPRKDWNRVFGLLSAFWGVQIVAANAIRLAATADAALLAGRLSVAFLLPLYFFLVFFAAIFPRPRGAFATNGLAVAALVVPAAVALAALFLAPGSLIEGIATTSAGAFTLDWGPLAPWVLTAPFYGAFFYALFTMMHRLDEAETTIERKQVAFVLAAFAVIVGHVTPYYLVFYARGGASVATLEAAGDLAFAGLMLASLALLVALAARLRRRARAGGAEERAEARGIVLAIAIAALSGGVAGLLRVEALGLFRIVSVALIVYAITRWQLFDLDLRVKQAAPVAGAVLGGAALAGAAWILLTEADVPGGLGGAIAAVLAVAAFVPLLRISYRVADRLAPSVSREGDHLYLRKLEVYRASVEARLREGKEAPPSDPDLLDLRRKLDLSERDHGVVVSLASSGAEPRPAAPDLRPGGVVFGKYALDSVVGEGGFGRVFLARDRVLGRQVVIKELLAKWRASPAAVKTFLNEARIAGQLAHPNIVTVHEVERFGQDHFVVLEYLPGGSLAERLEQGRLPRAEALRVARSLLEALDAAHARGVVHRDVKPANVLFGGRNEVKLADFGIATLAGEEVQERTISGLTTAMHAAGTVQWMSPEQARGLPVDHRADLYAVGAILHRMLTGRPHVDVAGLDELTARQAVANAKPAVDAAVDADLRPILAKALAPRPEDRYASARTFLEALAGR